MPITTPPGKATDRASLNEREAACAVRAFAPVAIRMPPKPQRTEHNAPPTNDTAVFQPRPATVDDVRPTVSSAATATTKIASTLYSRPRNAIAPSRMASWIWIIFSLPRSFARTRRAVTAANTNPTTPATMDQSASFGIDMRNLPSHGPGTGISVPRPGVKGAKGTAPPRWPQAKGRPRGTPPPGRPGRTVRRRRGTSRGRRPGPGSRPTRACSRRTTASSRRPPPRWPSP